MTAKKVGKTLKKRGKD